jgi:hypothetical protein
MPADAPKVIVIRGAQGLPYPGKGSTKNLWRRRRMLRKCLFLPKNFPVCSEVFPVNTSREILEKSLRHRVFRIDIVSLTPESADFPCKIPCLLGIRPETGAISTASPASHSYLKGPPNAAFLIDDSLQRLPFELLG